MSSECGKSAGISLMCFRKKTTTKQTVVACVINLRSSAFLLVSNSPAHMFSCCVAALFGLRVL